MTTQIYTDGVHEFVRVYDGTNIRVYKYTDSGVEISVQSRVDSMEPVKIRRWINLYRDERTGKLCSGGALYKTMVEALHHASSSKGQYIETVFIKVSKT